MIILHLVRGGVAGGGNRGFCNVNPAFGLYAAKPTEYRKHRKRH